MVGYRIDFFDISNYGSFDIYRIVFAIYRNMQVPIYVLSIMSKYGSFDRHIVSIFPTYRNMQLSMYPMERVLPLVPWHPRVFYAESILSESFHALVSKMAIVYQYLVYRLRSFCV